MLAHVETLLTAIGSTPFPVREGAVGEFWNVNVPLSHLPLHPITALFEYARTQKFSATFAAGLVSGTAQILPPLVPGPATLGVELLFECSVFRDAVHKRLELPYPSHPLRDLCQGQSADFGRLNLTADPRCLFPIISLISDAGHEAVVRLRWSTPLLAQLAATNVWGRLFRRWMRFDLHGFDITQTGAKIIATGPPRLLLPSLTWT